MNVFLAGKVDEKYGCWRDAFLWKEYVPDLKWQCPAWTLPLRQSTIERDWGSLEKTDGVLPWPVKSGAVLRCHDYVGPYRQIYVPENAYNKNEGYFHGVTAFGNHGQMNTDGMQWVAKYCRQALDSADMVFAYINSLDAYGTIADIAYAFARGTFVHVQFGSEFDWDRPFDYVEQFAHSTAMFPSYDAADDQGGLPRVYEPEREHAYLREAFHEACMNYIAWKERQASPPPSLPPGRIQSELQQIAKWSADPRVRRSVQNLLARLPS